MLKDNILRIEKVEVEDVGLYICMVRNFVGIVEVVVRLIV